MVPTNLDAKTLWKAVLAETEVELSPNNYKTWLAPTKAENLTKNSLDIICPTNFTKERLSTKLFPLLTECVNRHGKGVFKLNFIIRDPSADKQTKNGAVGPLFSQTQESKKQLSRDIQARAGLFVKFTFENYLKGKNNQLAFAIAAAVADNPGKTYNPFFLYSGVGLGKTHLMQAIGNEILTIKPDLKVLYCTGEDFTNELIDAIQSGKGRGRNATNEFRDKFRKVDVLLIDDIQFIIGKETTQEEFFHTFNALYMAQKQLVITSDRPPKDFATLEERITSRFGSGIIADIQPPDFDMRTAILRAKRDLNNDAVSNDVIEFIAEKINTNIRELEGAYLQVLTHAKTKMLEITVNTAATALGQSIREERLRPVNLNQILKAVCNYYSVKAVDIKGERRTKDLVVPRQVAMYLIKELTGAPLMTIGEFLGGRDHTTIIHGTRKVEGEAASPGKTRQDITNIKQMIYSLEQ